MSMAAQLTFNLMTFFALNKELIKTYKLLCKL